MHILVYPTDAVLYRVAAHEWRESGSDIVAPEY